MREADSVASQEREYCRHWLEHNWEFATDTAVTVDNADPGVSRELQVVTSWQSEVSSDDLRLDMPSGHPRCRGRGGLPDIGAHEDERRRRDTSGKQFR